MFERSQRSGLTRRPFLDAHGRAWERHPAAAVQQHASVRPVNSRLYWEARHPSSAFPAGGARRLPLPSLP